MKRLPSIAPGEVRRILAFHVRFLFSLSVLCVSAVAQIEATSPGAGILMTDKVLYAGQLLAAGVGRAEAVRILGPSYRVAFRPRRTSSAELLRNFDLTSRAMYQADMQIKMRALREGMSGLPAEQTFNAGEPKFKLAFGRCGVCWAELLEGVIGKGEALRLLLIGPAQDSMSIASIVLDKSRNGFNIDKPWAGQRDILLGDHAVRITQEPGRFTIEDIDLDTGRLKPTGN